MLVDQFCITGQQRYEPVFGHGWHKVVEHAALAEEGMCAGFGRVGLEHAIQAEALASDSQALVATLKLEIEKLRRQLFGTRSERTARLLEQYELQLEELEAAATEDELAAEQAAARTTTVTAFTQPPAPFHTVPRAWAGPSLLAMILFEKFGQHQPLNRQAERFAREGVPLSLSTLADQVGTATSVLKPLHDLMEAHVLAASRLHGDDTTVPVLAKGKTDTGRLWVYVRDDRPFGGPAPPAALFYYSRDRAGEHPERHLAGFTGFLQADAYSGYNGLYEASRQPAPVQDGLCWSHSRRKFFELADIAANARRGKDATPISPVALEAVTRIDALFEIERVINGLPHDQRLAVRTEKSAPLVADLETWMARSNETPRFDA